MDLSETIVAAMIGGMATVSAAVFQLISALRSSEKADPRAKRGSKLKSLLSIAALMVASAVGGFLYSEFLKQRSVEQMEAVRAELREVRELAALAAQRNAPPTPVSVHDAPVTPAPASPATLTASAVSTALASSSEALIYVPACQPECGESTAQRVALCGTVPAAAEVTSLELFAQPDALQQPWEQHVATLEQDLGGARFTGSSFEYPQSAQDKAVCVNFVHWSSAHPHLARLIVHYDAAAPHAAPAAAPTPTTAATDQTELVPQAASFIPSASAAP